MPHATSLFEGNRPHTRIMPDQNISFPSGHEALKIDQGLWQEPSSTRADSRSVNTIRGLVLDCCQQWNIGHGGKQRSYVLIDNANFT